MKQFLALFLTMLLTTLSGCASLFVDGKAPQDLQHLRYTMTFRFQRTVPPRDPELFYRFHANLARFYLDLAPKEHLSFEPNTQEIEDGTVIVNTEESGGQFLRHTYTVHIDKSAGTVEWISPNTLVLVKKWNLELHVATILKFHVAKDEIDEELTIAFGSPRDLDAARREKTDQIWEKHNKREMDNAFRIADALMDSGQIAHDPGTWTIDAVRSQLE